MSYTSTASVCVTIRGPLWILMVGDAQAQLSIARCYNHGKGVGQSFEKAFEHHMEAAKAGCVHTL